LPVTVTISGQPVVAGKVKAKQGLLTAISYKTTAYFSVTDGVDTTTGSLKTKGALALVP
jgi:hypothetical protein